MITQSKIRESLLNIFANNNLDNITDALIVQEFYMQQIIDINEVQKAVEMLTQEHSYLGFKTLLIEYKKAIEKELNKPNIITSEQELKTIMYEVVLSNAISFTSDNDPNTYAFKMQLLYDLIKYQFINTNKWDQNLAKHFNFVFPILQDWYSFFFSYTNRQAYDINKRFEPILPLGNISTEKNQVARFIAEKLCMESLPKAFVDEKEIDYGDDFKDRIDKAIDISCSFVQIVSNESFRKIGKTNWCQYEYDKYNDFLTYAKENYEPKYYDALKHNFFFLVMGSDLNSLRPAYLISEYRDWYSQIETINYLKFYTTDYSSFQSMIKNLAVAIIQAKKKLIDCI